MTKKAIIIIAAVMIIGAIILVWRNSQQQDDFSAKVTKAQMTLAVDRSIEVKVAITNFAFTPQIIKVKKGAKVIWVNQDDAPHTVTSDQGVFLASERLDRGGSYEKTFTEAGVYRYHCIPHP